jgi:3-dehydroquinate synthetase
LPSSMPKMKFPDLWQAMQHDKKVVKGDIHCVLPKQIGDVRVVPLVRESIRRWFVVQRSSSARFTDSIRNSASRSRPARKK